MTRTIQPCSALAGEIELPGDKSISHRALMISAIAEGESLIENLSTGQDVLSTVACLQQLGVEIERRERITIVRGVGRNGLAAPPRTLDVGNSGTTIRLLSGILAGQPFRSKLTGDESIRSRPMGRIIKPLRQMGAYIAARRDEYAPLTIEGGNLAAITYQLPVASAQVKSCVLLAGLYAEGRTTVIEPARTRDHTELMLVKYGANLNREGLEISVVGPAELSGQDVFVPGDLSSAAYFVVAAILCQSGDVTIRNVGINPTRKAVLSLLCDMGARIDLINVRNMGHELVADLRVRNSELQGVTIDGAIVPQVIDEIPILAVMATQARGRTVIRDARELRYKESDRLRSVCFNLQRMGVEVEEFEDGLALSGPQALTGAEIETFGDHRIAMSFAIAGLIATGETRLRQAQVADISFPGFYDVLESLTASKS